MTESGSCVHFLCRGRQLAGTGHCIPGLEPEEVMNSGAEGRAGVGSMRGQAQGGLGMWMLSGRPRRSMLSLLVPCVLPVRDPEVLTTKKVLDQGPGPGRGCAVIALRLLTQG